MKKFILAVLMMALVIVINPTFAQVQRETNLGDVIIKFCNDSDVVGGTKTTTLTAEPLKPLEICMLIQNDGPTDASISLNFVDGTITSDSDQKKACEPESTKTNFGQHITGYSNIANIPAGQTIKQIATATFPAGYAGVAYGCVTFQMLDESTDLTGSQQQMFKVISRRASFVDVDVLGDYIIDLQAQDATMIGSFPLLNSNKISIIDLQITPWQNINDVIAQKNPLALRIGKELLVRSNLVNSGNIGLDVSVHSQYRAWFGLITIDQGTQQQKFVPKQSKAIDFPTNTLAWWLGGPVTVVQDISYKPILLGSGASIDPILLQPQHMTLVSSGFITAWVGWSILVAIILLLILWIIYLINKRTRNRKITAKI